MVTISDVAAEKIKELMAKEGKQDYALRMKAEGGGCCGPKYMVLLEEGPESSDKVIETQGIKVLIDPESLSTLEKAELDYVEGLMGAGFQFKNSKVESSCGCQ